MGLQIDWSLLGRPTDIGGAALQGYQQGRASAASNALARDPYNRDALNTLYEVDPARAATMEKAGQDRLTFQNKRDTIRRQNAARGMIPDVLAGVGLGDAGHHVNALPTPGNVAPSGEVTVTAPVKHKTIADVYALDPDLAGSLSTQIGSMQEAQRKQLRFEADTLAAAAFAARQVPYAKRRDIIDQHRAALTQAGFTQDEIDNFDPSDEGLAGAITQSLGVKDALSQQLAEKRFDWQREDDRIDNARAARSEGRQEYYRARSDRRAQTRFNERALDRAALAGVRTDTSDLDY